MFMSTLPSPSFIGIVHRRRRWLLQVKVEVQSWSDSGQALLIGQAVTSAGALLARAPLTLTNPSKGGAAVGSIGIASAASTNPAVGPSGGGAAPPAIPAAAPSGGPGIMPPPNKPANPLGAKPSPAAGGIPLPGLANASPAAAAGAGIMPPPNKPGAAAGIPSPAPAGIVAPPGKPVGIPKPGGPSPSAAAAAAAGPTIPPRPGTGPSPTAGGIPKPANPMASPSAGGVPKPAGAKPSMPAGGLVPTPAAPAAAAAATGPGGIPKPGGAKPSVAAGGPGALSAGGIPKPAGAKPPSTGPSPSAPTSGNNSTGPSPSAGAAAGAIKPPGPKPGAAVPTPPGKPGGVGGIPKPAGASPAAAASGGAGGSGVPTSPNKPGGFLGAVKPAVGGAGAGAGAAGKVAVPVPGAGARAGLRPAASAAPTVSTTAAAASGAASAGTSRVGSRAASPSPTGAETASAAVTPAAAKPSPAAAAAAAASKPAFGAAASSSSGPAKPASTFGGGFRGVGSASAAASTSTASKPGFGYAGASSSSSSSASSGGAAKGKWIPPAERAKLAAAAAQAEIERAAAEAAAASAAATPAEEAPAPTVEEAAPAPAAAEPEPQPEPAPAPTPAPAAESPIPTVDANGKPIPMWKQKMMEKEREAAAKKAAAAGGGGAAPASSSSSASPSASSTTGGGAVKKWGVVNTSTGFGRTTSAAPSVTASPAASTFGFQGFSKPGGGGGSGANSAAGSRRPSIAASVTSLALPPAASASASGAKPEEAPLTARSSVSQAAAAFGGATARRPSIAGSATGIVEPAGATSVAIPASAAAVADAIASSDDTVPALPAPLAPSPAAGGASGGSDTPSPAQPAASGAASAVTGFPASSSAAAAAVAVPAAGAIAIPPNAPPAVAAAIQTAMAALTAATQALALSGVDATALQGLTAALAASNAATNAEAVPAPAPAASSDAAAASAQPTAAAAAGGPATPATAVSTVSASVPSTSRSNGTPTVTASSSSAAQARAASEALLNLMTPRLGPQSVAPTPALGSVQQQATMAAVGLGTAVTSVGGGGHPGSPGGPGGLTTRSGFFPTAAASSTQPAGSPLVTGISAATAEGFAPSATSDASAAAAAPSAGGPGTPLILPAPAVAAPAPAPVPLPPLPSPVAAPTLPPLPKEPSPEEIKARAAALLQQALAEAQATLPESTKAVIAAATAAADALAAASAPAPAPAAVPAPAPAGTEAAAGGAESDAAAAAVPAAAIDSSTAPVVATEGTQQSAAAGGAASLDSVPPPPPPPLPAAAGEGSAAAAPAADATAISVGADASTSASAAAAAPLVTDAAAAPAPSYTATINSIIASAKQQQEQQQQAAPLSQSQQLAPQASSTALVSVASPGRSQQLGVPLSATELSLGIEGLGFEAFLPLPGVGPVPGTALPPFSSSSSDGHSQQQQQLGDSTGRGLTGRASLPGPLQSQQHTSAMASSGGLARTQSAFAMSQQPGAFVAASFAPPSASGGTPVSPVPTRGSVSRTTPQQQQMTSRGRLAASTLPPIQESSSLAIVPVGAVEAGGNSTGVLRGTNAPTGFQHLSTTRRLLTSLAVGAEEAVAAAAGTLAVAGLQTSQAAFGNSGQIPQPVPSSSTGAAALDPLTAVATAERILSSEWEGALVALQDVSRELAATAGPLMAPQQLQPASNNGFASYPGRLNGLGVGASNGLAAGIPAEAPLTEAEVEAVRSSLSSSSSAGQPLTSLPLHLQVAFNRASTAAASTAAIESGSLSLNSGPSAAPSGVDFTALAQSLIASGLAAPILEAAGIEIPEGALPSTSSSPSAATAAASSEDDGTTADKGTDLMAALNAAAAPAPGGTARTGAKASARSTATVEEQQLPQQPKPAFYDPAEEAERARAQAATAAAAATARNSSSSAADALSTALVLAGEQPLDPHSQLVATLAQLLQSSPQLTSAAVRLEGLRPHVASAQFGLPTVQVLHSLSRSAVVSRRQDLAQASQQLAVAMREVAAVEFDVAGAVGAEFGGQAAGPAGVITVGGAQIPVRGRICEGMTVESLAQYASQAQALLRTVSNPAAADDAVGLPTLKAHLERHWEMLNRTAGEASGAQIGLLQGQLDVAKAAADELEAVAVGKRADAAKQSGKKAEMAAQLASLRLAAGTTQLAQDAEVRGLATALAAAEGIRLASSDGGAEGGSSSPASATAGTDAPSSSSPSKAPVSAAPEIGAGQDTDRILSILPPSAPVLTIEQYIATPYDESSDGKAARLALMIAAAEAEAREEAANKYGPQLLSLTSDLTAAVEVLTSDGEAEVARLQAQLAVAEQALTSGADINALSGADVSADVLAAAKAAVESDARMITTRTSDVTERCDELVARIAAAEAGVGRIAAATSAAKGLRELKTTVRRLWELRGVRHRSLNPFLSDALAQAPYSQPLHARLRQAYAPLKAGRCPTASPVEGLVWGRTNEILQAVAASALESMPPDEADGSTAISDLLLPTSSSSAEPQPLPSAADSLALLSAASDASASQPPTSQQPAYDPAKYADIYRQASGGGGGLRDGAPVAAAVSARVPVRYISDITPVRATSPTRRGVGAAASRTVLSPGSAGSSSSATAAAAAKRKLIRSLPGVSSPSSPDSSSSSAWSPPPPPPAQMPAASAAGSASRSMASLIAQRQQHVGHPSHAPSHASPAEHEHHHHHHPHHHSSSLSDGEVAAAEAVMEAATGLSGPDGISVNAGSAPASGMLTPGRKGSDASTATAVTPDGPSSVAGGSARSSSAAAASMSVSAPPPPARPALRIVPSALQAVIDRQGRPQPLGHVSAAPGGHGQHVSPVPDGHGHLVHHHHRSPLGKSTLSSGSSSSIGGGDVRSRSASGASSVSFVSGASGSGVGAAEGPEDDYSLFKALPPPPHAAMGAVIPAAAPTSTGKGGDKADAAAHEQYGFISALPAAPSAAGAVGVPLPPPPPPSAVAAVPSTVSDAHAAVPAAASLSVGSSGSSGQPHHNHHLTALPSGPLPATPLGAVSGISSYTVLRLPHHTAPGTSTLIEAQPSEARVQAVVQAQLLAEAQQQGGSAAPVATAAVGGNLAMVLSLPDVSSSGSGSGSARAGSEHHHQHHQQQQQALVVHQHPLTSHSGGINGSNNLPLLAGLSVPQPVPVGTSALGRELSLKVLSNLPSTANYGSSTYGVSYGALPPAASSSSAAAAGGGGGGGGASARGGLGQAGMAFGPPEGVSGTGVMTSDYGTSDVTSSYGPAAPISGGLFGGDISGAGTSAALSLTFAPVYPAVPSSLAALSARGSSSSNGSARQDASAVFPVGQASALGGSEGGSSGSSGSGGGVLAVVVTGQQQPANGHLSISAPPEHAYSTSTGAGYVHGSSINGHNSGSSSSSRGGGPVQGPPPSSPFAVAVAGLSGFRPNMPLNGPQAGYEAADVTAAGRYGAPIASARGLPVGLGGSGTGQMLPLLPLVQQPQHHPAGGGGSAAGAAYSSYGPHTSELGRSLRREAYAAVDRNPPHSLRPAAGVPAL